MKKISKVICTAMVLAMLTITPTVSNAHHGGSSWQTHYTYYQCVHNAGYFKYEQQHRHIGTRQEFRTISTRVSPFCPQ
ncbi:hypothetical protein [Evansella tamaricis]|uniref:Uncharacterized protein n=1 Tax=Evansella tamaricis TaxID=2069301 RepID=A0ABS6JL47_9BACI|nr:hypothetical protein [Evansella tamaricis]MBU9714105.1 hypothetical protein [Evansella tamaricis]